MNGEDYVECSKDWKTPSVPSECQCERRYQGPVSVTDIIVGPSVREEKVGSWEISRTNVWHTPRNSTIEIQSNDKIVRQSRVWYLTCGALHTSPLTVQTEGPLFLTPGAHDIVSLKTNTITKRCRVITDRTLGLCRVSRLYVRRVTSLSSVTPLHDPLTDPRFCASSTHILTYQYGKGTSPTIPQIHHEIPSVSPKHIY